MSTAFATHTANLKALMASSRFEVPRFQRNYSWRIDQELSDFWNDLSLNPKDSSYFMGILIVTENTTENLLSIVDGQQRTISLSLLANAIRIIAIEKGKSLIARSMRDGVLYGPDFDTDTYVPRLRMSSEKDKEVFETLISRDEIANLSLEGNVWDAQIFLLRKLRADVDKGPSRRLSDWASFVTEKIFLSVFINQDATSAYKVYEVVNARGKSLTPSEMIKAYIIGSVASPASRDQIYERWVRLEQRFERADASAQFTQFIRHTLTLRHGYVLPRDLYQVVTQQFQNDNVTDLVDFLEDTLDLYLSLVEPSSTPDYLPSEFSKVSTIVDLLGLSTVRPVFMAAAQLSDANTAMRHLLAIIVPRIVAGTFGTGAIESRFARVAQSIYSTNSWRAPIAELEELRPSRAEFEDRVANRRLNRAVLSVVRFSAIQRNPLPVIEGYLHFVRQGRSLDWPDFTDEDFDSVGRTIGNSVLLETESRPYGTRTPALVAQKFGPVLVDGEPVTPAELAGWSAGLAREKGTEIARLAGSVWYGEL
ncbi:DUF262 domain-containing protein [Gordonia lacunae]|uniref:DUF262 domain-containing protein n=1 Tax=Gordonia lacunae TaxID=417102 RepID=UPI0039E5AC55